MGDLDGQDEEEWILLIYLLKLLRSELQTCEKLFVILTSVLPLQMQKQGVTTQGIAELRTWYNVWLNNHEYDGDYVVLFGRVNFRTWSCNMNAMCMGLWFVQ